MMKDNKQDLHEIDPRLLKLIELLRPTPLRDAQKVEQSRARFLAETDRLIGSSEKTSQKKKFYQFQSKEKMNMNNIKSKFAFTTLFVVAALVVFLFGGTGLTVYAAQSALPGDALYPVKTGVEQTRLSLTAADDRLAQMHLSLAQVRLSEIERLIQEGRFDQVSKTAAEFQRHVQQMAEAIGRLAESDPVRASELTSQLMTEVAKYTQALTGLLANLPEDVKIEVEKAIIGSESASGMDDSTSPIEFSGTISVLTAESWTVAGRLVAINAQTEIKGTFAVGDMVKVHARAASDGSLTALEIEAAEGAGNANENANENEDANGNGNANENGNENENANGNSNENANENENENENENGNSSRNDSKFEFKGKVQTILPNLWVIGGMTVSVSSQTYLRGTIKVGDYVEVYAITLPDGSWQAVEIKSEDSSSSSNDNGDDNSNSNDNGDDSGSGSGGSDDNSNDDSNDSSGSDDSSNDDSSGSSGSDDNSNDDDSGGSDDDNSND